VVDFKFEFGVELLGTAPQIRVVDTGGPTNYDITIPAGTYFFSVDTTAKNDIIQTLEALIIAACSGSGYVALDVDGRRIDWGGADIGDGFTLRLLDCDDAEPLAMLLGLYGDNYDWDYYQSNDAPATWRVPGNVCWFSSGYDHPQYDADGFPVWASDHRVTEAGVSAHLVRARRDLVDLELRNVPGATLRGAWYDGAYGTGATDSVSLWRAYDPGLRAPLVHITCGTRWSGFYYLQEPITPDSVTRRFDRWSGYYSVVLKLAVADV
jgi:hypothetical protein